METITNKIVISGCSYSEHNAYSEFIPKVFRVDNIARPGQSNYSIINKVYDYVTQNNTNNCLFICQLTYLHRLGFYHSFVNSWVDYQPLSVNLIPTISNNSIKFDFDFTNVFYNSNILEKNLYVKEELIKMYETYLKYVFDEESEFLNLMRQVDFLKSFIDKTHNKIMFIFWPDIKNKSWLENLKKRNFFNIEGNYSMLNWSVSTNNIGDDSHLSESGSSVFSNYILKSNTVIELKKQLLI